MSSDAPIEIAVFVERGLKRCFAIAAAWPGWCRAGRDETSALGALAAYGPRYEWALRGSGVAFRAPAHESDFRVAARMPGTPTTDYGAPDAAWPADGEPVSEVELRRLEAILEACWRAFDGAASGAAGKELRTGPRGGGRDLAEIVSHLQGADEAYLSRVGGRRNLPVPASPVEASAATRRAMLSALEASAAGEIAPHGPRGGARWTARAFVRRAAWHALDHAWEIEDRVVGA